MLYLKKSKESCLSENNRYFQNKQIARLHVPTKIDIVCDWEIRERSKLPRLYLIKGSIVLRLVYDGCFLEKRRMLTESLTKEVIWGVMSKNEHFIG